MSLINRRAAFDSQFFASIVKRMEWWSGNNMMLGNVKCQKQNDTIVVTAQLCALGSLIRLDMEN